MAERSGPSRILALVLIGLGAFLVVAAILIPTYTISALEKTPLDLEVTTVSTGEGSVLDATSLAAGRAVVFTKQCSEDGAGQRPRERHAARSHLDVASRSDSSPSRIPPTPTS